MESRRLLLPWPPSPPPSGGIDAAPFPEGRKRRSVSRSGNGPSRRRIVMEALPALLASDGATSARSRSNQRSLLLFVSEEKCDVVSVLATEEAKFFWLLAPLLPAVFIASFGRLVGLLAAAPKDTTNNAGWHRVKKPDLSYVAKMRKLFNSSQRLEQQPQAGPPLFLFP